MKNPVRLFVFLVTLSIFTGPARGETVIRINQLGYVPESVKIAVLLSDEPIEPRSFELVPAAGGDPLWRGEPDICDASLWGKATALRLRFSAWRGTGLFRLRVGETLSPPFRIDEDVYKGTADFVLKYMRQQRCGYNPYLDGHCHRHDGVIVDHPTRTGEKIDVTGGWHDASDYLQYTATSANAVYQMLFAYQENPSAFEDRYDADGKVGPNGVPDILDEACWGLRWLEKMNPAPGEMYNQIADDRDHRGGYRMPTDDRSDYELGEARPVYFVTGKSQGLGRHKNRTTGVSSTAGKFASAFALGAELLRKYDPDQAARLDEKADQAWQFALSDLGTCQTACMISPYFYEEDNYVDDLELAAATLAVFGKKNKLLDQARYWGELEPVTPWMELNRARHYQFYPFVNLGHALLARCGDEKIEARFRALMRQGLEHLRRRGENDPFPLGVPFIWCSNNLVVAAATQAHLYRTVTGDRSYEELEAALRDWLLGCNPWGTSMICGLPENGVSPRLPHSAITYLKKETTYGGLVDGPVYRSIYESLLGIHLFNPDKYANYQGGRAVYHDDIGDYSTNEPTMDGTACLSYLLSALQCEPRREAARFSRDAHGAVVRAGHDRKTVYLFFSAHDFYDGKQVVAETLEAENVKASFFFTGEFYADPQHADWIAALVRQGHYLGAHSDKHLLYADWKDRRKTLPSWNEFRSDLEENFRKMAAFGLEKDRCRIFLPPFEWYNAEVVDWCRREGLEVVNFTSKITTYKDFTTPDQSFYASSEKILEDLKTFEKSDPAGFSGAFILIHLGTEPARTDKFYRHLGDLIRDLKKKGYAFDTVDGAFRCPK